MINTLKLLLCLLIVVYSVDIYPKNKYYIVIASALNVREAPELNGKLLSTLKKDSIVESISETNSVSTIENITAEWIRIKYDNDKTGFVFSGFLSELYDYSYKKDPLKVKYCRNIYNSYQCALAIEKEQVLQFSDKVKRKNDSLHIKTKNGLNLLFKNIPDKEYYTFVDYYSSLNYFILEKHFKEGGAFIVINESNGKHVEIWSKDYSISPDNNYMIVCSEDTLSGYYANGIQIIDLNSFKIINEIKIEGSFPSCPEWIDNTAFAFKRSVFLDPDSRIQRMYYIQKVNLRDKIFKN